MLFRTSNTLVTLVLFIPLFAWYLFLSLLIWNKKYLARVCDTAAFILRNNQYDVPVDWLPPPSDIEKEKI
jgi:hypothetical protein